MSGSTVPDACTRLREADAAWAALSTGASIRAVTDQDGSRVEFSTANRAGLLAYISTLQSQCSTYQALALGGGMVARPLRFMF